MSGNEKTCYLCGKDCAGQRRGKDQTGRYYHRVCLEATRICFLCGEHCANQPRGKDQNGRYFHLLCLEAARAEKLAASRELAVPAAPRVRHTVDRKRAV